jgi:hypothetical protein
MLKWAGISGPKYIALLRSSNPKCCTDVASALGIGVRSGNEIVFRPYHDSGWGGAALSMYGLRNGMVKPEFDSRSEENFSFSNTSRPPQGLTQPPLQWQPGSFPGLKWLERDTHTPPSSTEVKKARKYTSTPLCVFVV